jgi:hypothetical protein
MANKRKDLADNDSEKNLVIELYKKMYSHTDIAKCIQRERKLLKKETLDIAQCLRFVENTLLENQRRKP